MRAFRLLATFVFCSIIFATASTVLGQMHRRMLGTVTDQNGQPIAGVQIAVTSPELRSFTTDQKSDAKGEFTVLIIYHQVKQLEMRLEHPDFATVETTFEVPYTEKQSMSRSFKMTSRKLIEEAEAAKHDSEAIDLHNAGAEAAQGGDWKLAAEKFEASLAIKEGQAVTHRGLATACWNLQDWAKGETHARRSLELSPGDAEMQTLLADVLERQGKTDEANAELAKAADLDPALKAEMAFNRGAELYNSGKVQEAIVAFEAAIAADPDLGDAHYALGMAALGAADNAKARTHLKKFVELMPDSPKVETATAVLTAIPE